MKRGELSAYQSARRDFYGDDIVSAGAAPLHVSEHLLQRMAHRLGPWVAFRWRSAVERVQAKLLNGGLRVGLGPDKGDREGDQESLGAHRRSHGVSDISFSKRHGAGSSGESIRRGKGRRP